MRLCTFSIIVYLTYFSIVNSVYFSVLKCYTVKPVLSRHRIKRTPLLSGRRHLKNT